MTIGFVYAAIALGYTMVYGVLQFINFAHSEIFAIGAFCGVESLIALNGAGILAKAGTISSFGYLGLALLIGMAAAGGMAVLVERVAYRPLRNSPPWSRSSPPSASRSPCRTSSAWPKASPPASSTG